MVTRVEVGGTISNNKGLNLPDVLLPLAALTEKDRADLAFALLLELTSRTGHHAETVRAGSPAELRVFSVEEDAFVEPAETPDQIAADVRGRPGREPESELQATAAERCWSTWTASIPKSGPPHW